MSLSRRSIAWASCAVVELAGHAQQHTFIQYTPKDGLAQSQVRALAQDGQGYLWFGTLGGASRFDGATFSNYALREGLPEAQVQALLRDAAGRLWLAAGDGLLRYDGRMFSATPMPEEARGSRITVLAGDADRLVIGTDERGVFIREGSSVRALAGLPSDTVPGVRTLLIEPDGDVLIGSRNGLWRCRDGACAPVVVSPGMRVSVSALAIDNEGTLWVGTSGYGLYGLRKDGGLMEFDETNGLLQNNVRCLLIDGGGRLWVGTKFGLNVIEEGRIRAFTVHQGLPNDNIFCALRDDEDQLWFGTDGAGVLRYAGDRFVSFTTADGACSDLVMNITADGRGDLWLGTYGNGVCRMDAMAMVTTLDGLPNNTVWSGLCDRTGALWFGTSAGLSRVENGVVTPLPETVMLDRLRVLSLYEDQQGAIWCGHREGLSVLFRLDSATHYAAGPDGPGRSVRAIAADDRERLWLATDEGLSVFDGSGFARLTTRDGLCDDRVLCLAFDLSGRLWFGTENGIGCMEHGRFRSFRFGPDFGSNNIGLLRMDRRGVLWAGTNNGLFAFHPDSLFSDSTRYSAYDHADGLRSMEFNLNASFIDARGRLFFGTAGGVLMHDPAGTIGIDGRTTPRLYITGIRSFLQNTDWSKQCDSLERTTGLPAGLHLAYRRNYLTFDYGAINTVHPERLMYRYRLLGYDPDWLSPTDARFASYSNLTQGRYTFEVVASADGTHWSRPASFAFRIEPPFWLRWWFFAACAVALALVAWGIHRIRSLRRARREKTRQLMLRSRMLQLEQQALNAHMNRHFVFNALNSIQYYINRQDRTAANRYLTSFAKLIRKNLDASQSDTTTLAEELERLELYLTLEHMRFKDKFRYVMQIDPSVKADRVRIPAMMLQPYVENSIWHGILPSARHGQVKIIVQAMDELHIRVVIQDDGIGIEQSLSAKNGDGGDHISRGIEITKGRADVLRRLRLTDIRIDGPMQLHGPGGQIIGTRVTIDLPVGTGTEGGAGVLRTAPNDITFEVE